MGRHRWLWWVAAVGLLVHVLVFVPAVTLFLLSRQAESDRHARHEMCLQAQDERETMRDLFDFSTTPSPADPALIANVEQAAAVRVQNDRLALIRDYARTHLTPIDC